MRLLMPLAAVLALGACTTPAATAPAITASSVPRADLVVRDGDPVEASGRVLRNRFCAPAPDPLDKCELGVDLDGLDAGRLGPDGTALLRGVLRGGVLHVTA